MGVKEKLLAC